MIRKAVWAGMGKFYPGDAERLKEYLHSVIPEVKVKQQVKAVVLPHAGYMYSGAVAGKTISTVNVPDCVLILSPCHTGLGRPYSLMAEGTWITPLGQIKVNEKLVNAILGNSRLIEVDESAHIHEHAIEVELPFLRYLNDNVTIVPMVVADFVIENYKKVGAALAASILQYNEPVLIVASSDMSHYEPQKVAKEKDTMAIEAVMELNPEKLLKIVRENKISMCGIIPVAVALFACKELAAKKAELIDYQTSGDITGDYSSVVGYAGIIIH